MTSGIPEDVIVKLQKLDDTITALENSVSKVLEGGIDKHFQRSAHDMALVDTMSLFLMDSLLWAVQGVKGESPDKNEELIIDLNRTKRMAAEMKEVNARQDAPRVNQQAAANFVRNALWEVPENDSASSSKK